MIPESHNTLSFTDLTVPVSPVTWSLVKTLYQE